MTLSGKVALVTGSGNGIGRQTALALAYGGANVVIADIDWAAAERVRRQIVENGGNAMAIKADVTQKDDVKRLFSQIETAFGKLDILVNNVGGTIRKPTIEFTEDEWDSVVNVNLKTVFLCSQQAGRFMLKQKAGVVINISSIHGLGGISRRNPYATSKTAINSFTKTLACEWALDGVRVNAIAPGYISTENLEKAFEQGVLSREDMIRRTPMNCLGTPEDIADAVLFLASDKAKFITGITLYVDGGYSAYHGPEAAPSFHHSLGERQ